jgi:SAM-dependent methyltransferase
MAMLRGWSQLAWTVKGGIPAPRTASIRGAAADRRAFIEAMHAINIDAADALVARLGPPAFDHLLDVGGASGTWTLAFLRARPSARATIFDLPDAINQARDRVGACPEADRIDLAAGDFYTAPLPAGADFAWVSAIVHQHGREENRRLFGKVFDALQPGGRVAVRDMVMQPSRTAPPEGALFAINMLVNTESGGTFTFEELAADLTAAGFEQPELTVADAGMNCVVTASKPVSTATV